MNHLKKCIRLIEIYLHKIQGFSSIMCVLSSIMCVFSSIMCVFLSLKRRDNPKWYGTRCKYKKYLQIYIDERKALLYIDDTVVGAYINNLKTTFLFITSIFQITRKQRETVSL